MQPIALKILRKSYFVQFVAHIYMQPIYILYSQLRQELDNCLIL
jgi:hypothetical protein